MEECMDKTKRWELIANEFGVAFWVSDVVPLSVAEATVGKKFGEVIDFTNNIVAIYASAKVFRAESEPTGTSFELSIA